LLRYASSPYNPDDHWLAQRAISLPPGNPQLFGTSDLVKFIICPFSHRNPPDQNSIKALIASRSSIAQ
jgi:hypothetical protein